MEVTIVCWGSFGLGCRRGPHGRPSGSHPSSDVTLAGDRTPGRQHQRCASPMAPSRETPQKGARAPQAPDHDARRIFGLDSMGATPSHPPRPPNRSQAACLLAAHHRADGQWTVSGDAGPGGPDRGGAVAAAAPPRHRQRPRLVPDRGAQALASALVRRAGVRGLESDASRPSKPPWRAPKLRIPLACFARPPIVAAAPPRSEPSLRSLWPGREPAMEPAPTFAGLYSDRTRLATTVFGPAGRA
jgi:hypothetical protein